VRAGVKDRKRKECEIMKFSRKNALLAFVVGAAALAAYQYLQKPDDTRPGQAVPIVGNDHIADDAPTPEYNSNPPTSGSHSSPVGGGFYNVEVKAVNAMHNLEHGFIWITYKNVDDQTLASLAKIGQKFPGTVVVSRREANDTPIALASWGRLAKMEAFDEAFIIDFIWKNRNNSPERFAR
jgi:uncharacterized protein DUF3105